MIDLPTNARPVRSAVQILFAAGLAAIVAVAVAPLSLSLPMVAAVLVLALVLTGHHDLLAPYLEIARRNHRTLVDAIQRRNLLPRRGRPLILAVSVVGSGAVAYFLGDRGLIAVGAIVAVVLLALGVLLAQPLLVAFVATPPTDVAAQVRVASGADPSSMMRFRGIRAMALLGAIGVSGVAAFFMAGLGMKGVAAAVGAISIGGSVALVKDRTTFLIFGMTTSLAVVLHKSFSAIDVELSGGAVSVYVTTFDLMVVLCYLNWILEGTFRADLVTAWRGPMRRLLHLPLWGAVMLLPSVLVAPNTLLSFSELVRMGWMYLLFLFLAVRVRNRRHVWAVLGGLATFACLELVVVVLQWKTGGVLGLDFLGVPKELGERVTNDGSLGRPFGTIIHPVFMGAVMGSLAAVSLGLACTLRRSLTQRTAVALVPICVLPLYLSHTRASFVAFALVAATQVLWAVGNRWVSVKALRTGIAVLVLVGTAFAPSISAKISENFGTAHYDEEVQSRLELNDVAGKMIGEKPIIGFGLNNFESVMDPYQQYGLIFADNPVHNLYLLVLSETGIVGFVGVVAVGIGFYAAAMRLARSRDPLHAGIGLGFSGVIAFLMIEEILGFSLRQDIPLALFWMLAGLCVSCVGQGRQAGSLPLRQPWTSRFVHPITGAGPRHPMVKRLASPVVGVMCVAALSPALGKTDEQTPLAGSFGTVTAPGTTATTATAASASALAQVGVEATSLLLSATDRATGNSGIYTVAPGGQPVRITPNDGRVYSWPSWSGDARKVAYTVRRGAPGAPEEIEVMNPDGSMVQRVTNLGYRTGQPKFSRDGKSIIFTAVSPTFEIVAVYSMNLDTEIITNLSAVDQPVASADADPRFTDDGRIVLAEISGTAEKLAVMNSDGTQRQVLVDNNFFNTDPDLSPDGRLLATASFRGGGDPRVSGTLGDSAVRIDQWFLVLHDLKSKQERILTKGLDCTTRTGDNQCLPGEGSAFKPRWSPDGKSIGFESTRDGLVNCICVIDKDGSNPRSRFESSQLAITWFDWTGLAPTDQSPPLSLGKRKSNARLLITSEDNTGQRQLLNAAPDLSRWEVLSFRSATSPMQLRPEQAMWSAQRERVVFGAATTIPNTRPNHPPPPQGKQRTVHFTLDELTPGASDTSNDADVTIAEQQLFLREVDGDTRQLTDPWTEDWRDGHADGDLHGNINPVMSPDGTKVVYTSVSSRTAQSSVMSLDLRTNEVISLTNATAGAVATDDDRPTISPDGKWVAFTTSVGASKEIAVVSLDGMGFITLTNDDWFDLSPAWSPDGKSLVYASFRGRSQRLVGTSTTTPELNGPGWNIIRLDLNLNTKPMRVTTSTTLTKKFAGPAFEPVWSPTGDRVAFVSRGASSFDVFVVPSTGGKPKPLASTPFINELHVDWR
jgi:Tol biopolymer transport system component/O-antigen ligase